MKNKEKIITKEYLHYLFKYDNGKLIWRNKTSKYSNIKIGEIAGCKDEEGYVNIGINGKIYRVARLVWLYFNGDWPEFVIDHENRIRDDNRIENLRPATYLENNANVGLNCKNTSGHKGISWSKSCKKWHARIRHKPKNIHVGYFENIEDAVKARDAKALELQGEFAWLNRQCAL